MIALEVDDMEKTTDYLRTKGVDIVWGPAGQARCTVLRAHGLAVVPPQPPTQFDQIGPAVIGNRVAVGHLHGFACCAAFTPNSVSHTIHA